MESQRVVSLVESAQGANRIWLCGSYAGRGIPLLENAVTSAFAVSAAIYRKECIPYEIEGPVVDEKPKSMFSPWFLIIVVLTLPIVTASWIRRK